MLGPPIFGGTFKRFSSLAMTARGAPALYQRRTWRNTALSLVVSRIMHPSGMGTGATSTEGAGAAGCGAGLGTRGPRGAPRSTAIGGRNGWAFGDGASGTGNGETCTRLSA